MFFASFFLMKKSVFFTIFKIMKKYLLEKNYEKLHRCNNGIKKNIKGPLDDTRSLRKFPLWEELPLKLTNPIMVSGSYNLKLTEKGDLKRMSPSGENNDFQTNDEQNCKKKKISKSLVLGLTYGLFSGLFFAACAASVKYLEELDPGQVACNQYLAITVFSLPMVIKCGGNILGPHPNTKYWFILCGFFDAVTVYLSFMSFKYLPLSDATVLTSSVPVFVTIAARIFLKEKCGTFQIIAIVISVVGVALVSKLPLLMANRVDVYTKESVIGLLASLGSILTESGVYVILRKLHDVNVYIILFNFGIVATIVNALLTVIFGEFTLTVCGLHQWLVIAVGVFSFLCQLTLTKALELEEAGPVSVLMAAGDIILAFILDMTLFQDTPDIYTICGTVLVVSSVMLVGIRKWLDGNLRKRSMKLKLMKVLY